LRDIFSVLVVAGIIHDYHRTKSIKNVSTGRTGEKVGKLAAGGLTVISLARLGREKRVEGGNSYMIPMAFEQQQVNLDMEDCALMATTLS
jgi:hypothetical protein